MPRDRDLAKAAAAWPEIVCQVRERTPARLLAGRVGAAYRTETQLDLREAHAAARDAVQADWKTEESFGQEFLRRWNLLEVATRARSTQAYLLRPDLGRYFDDPSREQLLEHGSKGCQLQIAIGDGLSVPALLAQVPRLLPILIQSAVERGWSLGRILAIRHCRVGILNDIGELLSPAVVVLLIGERPGLATAESLSAYMAYQPRASHTDADRNLVSNIHARGLHAGQAVHRIVSLAESMMRTQLSGWNLRLREPAEPRIE